MKVSQVALYAVYMAMAASSENVTEPEEAPEDYVPELRNESNPEGSPFGHPEGAPDDSEVSTVSWCTQNADCAVYGDTSATCTDNKCTCGMGYANPTRDGVTIWACIATSDASAFFGKVSTVRLDGVYPSGNCEQIPVTTFKTLIMSVLGISEYDSFVIICGSVHYSLVASVRNTLLGDLTALKGDIDAAVSSNHALDAALGASQPLHVAAGSLVECEMANAAATFLVNGACHAVTCQTGYALTHAGPKTCAMSAAPVDQPQAAPITQLPPSSVPVAPIAIPEAVPVAPETVPMATPATVPLTVPRGEPSTIPEVVPASVPEPFPEDLVPEAVPEATPEAVPETTPETVPTVSPVAPASEPETMPESAPENATTPRDTPATVPVVPAVVPEAIPAIPAAVPEVIPASAPVTVPLALPPVLPPVAIPSATPEVVPLNAPVSTPVVVPEATPQAVPVDPVRTSWCTQNADCAVYGDTSAICTDNKCTCGMGYANPTRDGVTIWACIAISEMPTFFDKTSRARIDGVYPSGNCELFNDNGSTKWVSNFRSLVKIALNITGYDSFTVVCGSVHYSLVASVKNSILGDLTVLQGDIDTAVEGDAGMNGILGASQPMQAAVGNLVECASANAAASSLINGVCHAVTCQQGYALVQASPNVCVIVTVPPTVSPLTVSPATLAPPSGGDVRAIVSSSTDTIGILIIVIVTAVLIICIASCMMRTGGNGSHPDYSDTDEET